MTKQNSNNLTIDNNNSNDFLVKGAPKGAINTPKPNSIAIAAADLAKICALGVQAKPGNFSPLGHKANAKNGVIDNAILQGKCHTIEQIISLLINSGLKVVNDDIALFGHTDLLQGWLAYRVYDHIDWVATQAKTHGGLDSRLANMSLVAHNKAIAEKLTELNKAVTAQFVVNYQAKYNAAKKFKANLK